MPDQRAESTVLVTEQRIIRVRWAAIVIGLATVPLMGSQLLWPLAAVLAAAAAYNLVFQFLIIPYRPQWLQRGYASILGDVALASLAVWASGGLASPFYLLYLPVAVVAAIRFGGGAAVFSTGLALVAYTAVVMLAGLTLSAEVIGEVLLRIGFVGLTGVFVGYVGDRSRATEQALAQELDNAHRRLSEASARLNQSLDPATVLRSVGTQVRVLLEADLALVELSPDRMGEEIRRVLGRDPGLHRAASTLPAGQSLLQALLAAGTLGERQEAAAGCAWFTTVPLRYGDEVLGTLTLARVGGEPPRTAQQSLIEPFAARSAIALANALLYAKAQLQATTDLITGVSNHRHFKDRLREEWLRCQRRGRFLSLLMIDVDNFKRYNDTYGHPAGDEALRAVAQILNAEIRPGDLVARYGGDEFVAMLPEIGVEAAVQVAERILARFTAGAGHLSPMLSLSIGAAALPTHGTDLNTLVSMADLSMYLSKQLGGNQVYTADDLKGGQPFQDLLDSLVAMARPLRRLDPRMISDLEHHIRQDEDQGVAGPILLDTVRALSAALEAKDKATCVHSHNVARYARALGARLGLDEIRQDQLALAGLMHDIGKIAVADHILRKPGGLEPGEAFRMQQHSVIGAQLLSAVTRLQPVLQGVRYHHEYYDGSGYPSGLAADAIPLESRIILVCDAFDVILAERSYKKGLDKQSALEILERGKGSQFDPQVVDAFCGLVRENSPALVAELPAAWRLGRTVPPAAAALARGLI